MKVWYHLVAALVGLSIAALIVYVVFGSASEQGATQDGSAGSLSAGESLCGSIAPSEATSEKSRSLAGDNLPVLADEKGPIPEVSADKPEQQAWFARVHAAAGLCADEIKVEPGATTITMSTLDDVTVAEAGQFATGSIAQAFTQPLQRPRVTLIATVDGKDRTVVMSRRAWDAFTLAREARSQPLTMMTLVQFRRATSFAPSDLRVVGWG